MPVTTPEVPSVAANLLITAKKLGELYSERAALEKQIQALESQLINFENQPIKAKRARREYLLKPTLDILEMLGDKSLNIDDLMKENRRRYGAGSKYTKTIILGAMYRLEKKGIVSKDEFNRYKRVK